MESAVLVKGLVMIEAATMPRFSKMVPSATLAALQLPQSPTPAITTSQCASISFFKSSGTGRAKLGFMRW